MTDNQEPAAPAARASDNLRTMTIKVRGEHCAGKSQLILAIARLAESYGMTTRADVDGHNLTIIASKAERMALYAANRTATVDAAAAGRLLAAAVSLGDDKADCQAPPAEPCQAGRSATDGYDYACNKCRRAWRRGDPVPCGGRACIP